MYVSVGAHIYIYVYTNAHGTGDHDQQNDEHAEKSSKRRTMVPMTKEQAEEGKDKISRVFDEDTGRCVYIFRTHTKV